MLQYGFTCRGQRSPAARPVDELGAKLVFEQPETPLPTLISNDLALTATPPRDGAGARAQVVRCQPDGSWLRVLDQPEFTRP